MNCFDAFWDRAVPHGIQWPFHLWQVPFLQGNHTDWVPHCGGIQPPSHRLQRLGLAYIWTREMCTTNVCHLFMFSSPISILPYHSMLDMVFCLHELHGRNTGLQQLEPAMQCILSPSQKISKWREAKKILADKNIFQISGPIKPKD